MLKIIIGISIILLIALVGYRRTFVRLPLPLGARILFLTGTEFIFVGFALGDELIGLLDEATVRSLTPIFSLGLGFIGLVFGIQLEKAKILAFPLRYLMMAGIQAAVTMAVIFVPFYFILGKYFVATPRDVLLGTLMLASIAACTAPTVLALLGREFRFTEGRVMELLRYIASLDSVAGLTLFGFIFCLARGYSGPDFEPLQTLAWFALSLGLGLAMGFLLHLLTQVRCSDEELVLFVMGLIVFTGGVALYLKLSPLFVNLVMGITAGNLPGARNRIFNLLAGLEKPIYIVFLILAGAIWNPGPWLSYLLAGLYLMLRLVGKVSGGYLAARGAAGSFRVPGGLGLGLVSLGGMAIAMVMNWYKLHSGPIAETAVTAVLTAVILNELISPALARSLLRSVGEIRE